MEQSKSRLSLFLVLLAAVSADPQQVYAFGYGPSMGYYAPYGPLPFQYRVNSFWSYINSYGQSASSGYPAELPPLSQLSENAATRGSLKQAADLGPIAQDVKNEDPFSGAVPNTPRDSITVENPDRVIGGSGLAQGTFPGYAVMVYGYKPFCGGTLITRKHILTAGHCINYIWDIFTGYMSGVRIFLNTVTISPLNSRTVVRAVSNYWRHPSFKLAPSGQFYQYDIAVLQLDYDVHHIPRIRLADVTEEGYLGDALDVYGFGWTGPPNSTYFIDSPYLTSNNLNKGRVSMVSNVECANTYGYPELNDTLYICTQGADPCFGDGGAPVMDDFLQVAVSALNTWTCNITSPAINTRISLFKDWIRYVIDSE